MGRWSPTVLPSGEGSPFWGGFQSELSRALADSPAQAIAWDRNKIARMEMERRNRELDAQEQLDYQHQDYRPTTTADYETVTPRLGSGAAQVAPGLLGANLPGALKDAGAPTHMMQGRRWQYAPRKAQAEEDAVSAQHQDALIAARRAAFQSAMTTEVPAGMGVGPGVRVPNAGLGPNAQATYELTGALPPRAPRPAILPTTEGYMSVDEQGTPSPVEYQGHVLKPRPPASATPKPKDYTAIDNAYYSTRYTFYLRPDKWGVAMSPDEADRKAKADVRRRRIQRRGMMLSEELGPDDNGDEGDE